MRVLRVGLGLVVVVAAAVSVLLLLPGARSLEDLKAAVVYVKVRSKQAGSSGTGIVVRREARSLYVVTSAHALAAVPAPDRTVLVVVHSGTARERALAATVLGEDPSTDLAVLRVDGDDVPAPIDDRRRAEPRETMPIRVLGFPFGDRLALGRANPSVSIGTGTVSRARIDEYERFQIDADVNEGNSGGPVVDERGRLVGVAVARVAGTRIGLAVHAKWVDEVFQGRVIGSTIKLSEPAGAGPRRKVLLEYELLDPLQTMRAVSLFLVRRDRVRWPAPPPEDFRWSLLAPDMLEVPLRIEGRRALAEVVLDTPEAYVAQHRYVRGSGQAVVSSPYELVERKQR